MRNYESVISVHDSQLLLTVANAVPPTPEEWNAYLAKCEELRKKYGSLNSVRTLSIIDAGGPNAVQRKQYATTLNGETPREVVLTLDVATRAIGAMLRFFNPSSISVDPKRATDALDHVGTPAPRSALADELEALSRRVPESRAVQMVIAALRE